MASPVVTLEYKGRIAIITIANEKKANALTQDQYYQLASHLRDVATHDEVFITLLTAKGILPSPGQDQTTNCCLQGDSSQRKPLRLALIQDSNTIQRRRCNSSKKRPRRRRPLQTQSPLLRIQQPKHHTSLLHPPEDLDHRTQRACRRPLRRPHRILGFHLQRSTRFSPHAFLLPRSRRRRRCFSRFRPTARHIESERSFNHVQKDQ